MPVKSQENKRFVQEDCIEGSFSNAIFLDCVFENCTFQESDFRNAHFSECTFRNSNLHLVKLDGCRFQDVLFDESKIVEVEDSKRDIATLQIIGLGQDRIARSVWGNLTGYSSRALVETAFSRYKRIFGGKLFSKTTDSQIVENRYKWCLLNKMIRV